jgi:hypothetical protein
MADGIGTTDKRKKRGGSETRKRTRLTAHRWLEDEFNAVASRAKDAGYSFGAYVRACALGDAGPRSQRIPPVENENLTRLLGGLGRLNNRINQIAHNGNAGFPVDLPELKLAMKDYFSLRDGMLEALGKTPSGHAIQTLTGLARESKSMLKASPGAETITVPAEFLKRIVGSLTAPQPAGQEVQEAPEEPPNAPKKQPSSSRFMPPAGPSTQAPGA